MHAMTPTTPLEPCAQTLSSRRFQLQLDTTSPWQRARSATTEFVDPGEEGSEFEEDSPISSPASIGRGSQTTISTNEEVRTPRSNHQFDLHVHVQDDARPVEGPKGPHLFRSSSKLSGDFNFDFALQMSPLLPKEIPLQDSLSSLSATMLSSSRFLYPTPPISETHKTDVRTWTADQVALWMYQTGFEESVVEKFESHDITGSILLELEFGDLKELGVVSFGKRHELWNKIGALHDAGGRISPCRTPFEDITRPCTSNAGSNSPRNRRHGGHDRDTNSEATTPASPCDGKRRRGRRHRRAADDVISPAESVSIVAIEQLLPKPHKCSKGENCAKWKRQQKQLQRLRDEHGFPISPEEGGRVFIAGDPGNPRTAENVVENVHRPASEAQPSVIASSDLLGPGQLPPFALQEDLLRNMEARDPQENVKHFLNFQHVEAHGIHGIVHQPPSPPPRLEMFPPMKPPKPVPHEYLTSLPKLRIPRSHTSDPYVLPDTVKPLSVTIVPSLFHAFSPGTAKPRNNRPLSKDERWEMMYSRAEGRGGCSPASEMDVPVTAIPIDPIIRDTSHSVPPNMQYRPQQKRTSMRPDPPWHRPSFALPRVDEHYAEPMTARPATAQGLTTEHAHDPTSLDDVKHSGWMRKRRTKLLRHEWQNHHFRLAGTTLAMHKDETTRSPLDTIDVENYAVACSSTATTSKLSAALKSLKLAATGRKGKDDAANGRDNNVQAAAFSFQLVPTAPAPAAPSKAIFAPPGTKALTKEKRGAGRAGAKPEAKGGMRAATSAAMVGLGLGLAKTHHFAVRSREDRMEWMRELMVAKALRQKGMGYDVCLNGKQI